MNGFRRFSIVMLCAALVAALSAHFWQIPAGVEQLDHTREKVLNTQPLLPRAEQSDVRSNDRDVVEGEYFWFDNTRCEIFALEKVKPDKDGVSIEALFGWEPLDKVQQITDNEGEDASALWLHSGTKPEPGNCIVIHYSVASPGWFDGSFTIRIHLQLPEKVISGDAFDMNVVTSNRKTFVDKDRRSRSKLNDTEATIELLHGLGGRVLSDKEHGRSKGGWHAQATKAEKIGSVEIMSITPRIVTIRLKLLEERIGGQIGAGVSYHPESIALIRVTPDAR